MSFPMVCVAFFYHFQVLSNDMLKCLYIFCRLANVNFRLKIAKIFFPDFLPRRNAFDFVFCIFHQSIYVYIRICNNLREPVSKNFFFLPAISELVQVIWINHKKIHKDRTIPPMSKIFFFQRTRNFDFFLAKF